MSWAIYNIMNDNQRTEFIALQQSCIPMLKQLERMRTTLSDEEWEDLFEKGGAIEDYFNALLEVEDYVEQQLAVTSN